MCLIARFTRPNAVLGIWFQDENVRTLWFRRQRVTGRANCCGWTKSTSLLTTSLGTVEPRPRPAYGESAAVESIFARSEIFSRSVYDERIVQFLRDAKGTVVTGAVDWVGSAESL